MSRERVAGIGFKHPDRNDRPLTKRKLAVAHLLMAAALVICILVALTAVAIGTARADTLGALASGDEGVAAIALFLGLMLAATGSIVASVIRRA
ncbi:hypothetical protein [Pseudorhodoplanes sp.]|uniref:hypothetical protein n=1 Tax=Pseudorhodoplanes sp. TaxID=1934341 RepID=UPI00391A3E8B